MRVKRNSDYKRWFDSSGALRIRGSLADVERLP